MLKIFTALFFFVLTSQLYGQRADTTIHKRHYSFCSYYPGIYDRIGLETDEPKILFCLGNYQETLKTGHWLYYYPGGRILAEGNYKNGVKIKKWKYYSIKGDATIVVFSEDHPTTENIKFSAGNSPEIYDIIKVGESALYLKNGSFTLNRELGHPLFLD